MKGKNVLLCLIIVLLALLIGTRLWQPLEAMAQSVKRGDADIFDAVTAFCYDVVSND